MACVCLYVFSALAAHFRALVALSETFFAFFLHFWGAWDSIVTLGAPLCHPCWRFLQVFRSWEHLEAQFADPWVPFGRLWGPFWDPLVYIFMALGPDPGFFFDFSRKGSKMAQTKKEKGS